MSAPTEHEDDVALQYEAGLVCLTSKCAVALLKEHATCNGCNSQLFAIEELVRSRSSTLENIPSIHRDAGECILAIIASDATKSKVLEACAQLMEAKHKVIQGAHSAKKLRASTSLVDRMKRRVSDVASIKACAACLSAMAQDNECRALTLAAGCLQAVLGAQLAHAYEPGVQLRLCQAMARICAAEPPAGTAAVHLNAIETCTTCALQSHRDDPHVLEAALSALAWLIRAGGSDAAVRASYLSLPEAVFDVTHKKFAQDPVIAGAAADVFEALLDAGDANHAAHLGSAQQSSVASTERAPTQAEIAAAAAMAATALAAADSGCAVASSSALDPKHHCYLAKHMEPILVQKFVISKIIASASHHHGKPQVMTNVSRFIGSLCQDRPEVQSLAHAVLAAGGIRYVGETLRHLAKQADSWSEETRPPPSGDDDVAAGDRATAQALQAAQVFLRHVCELEAVAAMGKIATNTTVSTTRHALTGIIQQGAVVESIVSLSTKPAAWYSLKQAAVYTLHALVIGMGLNDAAIHARAAQGTAKLLKDVNDEAPAGGRSSVAGSRVSATGAHDSGRHGVKWAHLDSVVHRTMAQMCEELALELFHTLGVLGAARPLPQSESDRSLAGLLASGSRRVSAVGDASPAGPAPQRGWFEPPAAGGPGEAAAPRPGGFSATGGSADLLSQMDHHSSLAAIIAARQKGVTDSGFGESGGVSQTGGSHRASATGGPAGAMHVRVGIPGRAPLLATAAVLTRSGAATPVNLARAGALTQQSDGAAFFRRAVLKGPAAPFGTPAAGGRASALSVMGNHPDDSLQGPHLGRPGSRAVMGGAGSNSSLSSFITASAVFGGKADGPLSSPDRLVSALGFAAKCGVGGETGGGGPVSTATLVAVPPSGAPPKVRNRHAHLDITAAADAEFADWLARDDSPPGKQHARRGRAKEC